MPECPDCKKQIETLVEVCCEYRAGEAKLGDDGFLEYEGSCDTRSNEVIHYECPKCEAILHHSSGQAIVFLGGGGCLQMNLAMMRTTAESIGGKIVIMRGVYLFVPGKGEPVFLGLTEQIAIEKLMEMYESIMQPVVDELTKGGMAK